VRVLAVVVSVHQSVTSQCSKETAKHRIIQTMPHDSPETDAENLGKTQMGSPPLEAPNAGGVG